MPLYFFNLRRTGRVVPDAEGVSFAGIDEAVREAFLDARALISDRLRTDEPVPLDDTIDIADEHGVVLFSITFEQALTGAP